jgi:hypothetical protein
MGVKMNEKMNTILEKLNSKTIIILRADNGALLVSRLNSIEPDLELFVFEPEATLENLIDLHYVLDSLLGVDTSKHNRLVINHQVEHGSSYECNDKNCKICSEKEV